MNNKIDEIMRNLAEYTRLQEETSAIIDGLKDGLKNIMQANNTDILQGTEHKATYKPVASSRVDTTALKKELPEVAAKYTPETINFRLFGLSCIQFRLNAEISLKA